MKINIKSVEFKNLLSFGNKWQRFEPNNITFINGLNLTNNRRNFTGKSNLLKMFPYSLFGKVEGLNKQRLVNWKNRKNAESYITFLKDENEYSIHRGIKPDILEVYENGEKVPTPSNKTDFQKQIETDILGMDYKQFMNTAYADINNSQSILTMGKPQKRQFLEQIFDLEYYTNLKELSNKRLNNIKSKIDKIENDNEHYKKQVNDLTEQISKLQSDLGNVSDSSKGLDQLNRDIEYFKHKNNQANEQLPKLENEKESLEHRVNKLSESLLKIKYKIKYLKSHIIDKTNIEDINELYNQKGKIEKQKQEYEDFINEMDNNLESNIEKSTRERDEIKKQYTILENELNRLRQEYKDIKYNLDNPTNENICPTCYQNVDHEHIKNHLENMLNDTQNDIQVKNDEFENVKNKLIFINEVLETSKQTQNDIKRTKDLLHSTITQLTHVDQKIKENEELNEKLKKSDKYKSIIELLNRKYNELEQIYHENKLEVSPIEDRIKEHKNFQDEYIKASRKYENVQVNIDNEKKQRERIQKWIDECIEKKKTIGEYVNSNNKEIKRLKSIQDYVKVIKDLCDDQEAKAYTLSNKVPVLNQRVNYYLNKAGVNYYVKLDSWLEPEIKGPGIKDCSFENLSGAERLSLTEAMRFAFNDINRLQSSNHVDLLILDEIVGSNSLDNVGVQNIMNIIKTKQEEDNSNVLIVSHAPNINEFEHLIDNFVQVQYDGSYSKVINL